MNFHKAVKMVTCAAHNQRQSMLRSGDLELVRMSEELSDALSVVEQIPEHMDTLVVLVGDQIKVIGRMVPVDEG